MLLLTVRNLPGRREPMATGLAPAFWPASRVLTSPRGEPFSRLSSLPVAPLSSPVTCSAALVSSGSPCRLLLCRPRYLALALSPLDCAPRLRPLAWGQASVDRCRAGMEPAAWPWIRETWARRPRSFAPGWRVDDSRRALYPPTWPGRSDGLPDSSGACTRRLGGYAIVAPRGRGGVAPSTRSWNYENSHGPLSGLVIAGLDRLHVGRRVAIHAR